MGPSRLATNPDSVNVVGIPPSTEYVADVDARGSSLGIRENHFSEVPMTIVSLISPIKARYSPLKLIVAFAPCCSVIFPLFFILLSIISCHPGPYVIAGSPGSTIIRDESKFMLEEGEYRILSNHNGLSLPLTVARRIMICCASDNESASHKT